MTVKETGNLIRKYMFGIDGMVNYYENRIDFIQTVMTAKGVKISGNFWYQVCNDNRCLVPQRCQFSFVIK